MVHRINNRFVAPKWMGFYISLLTPHSLITQKVLSLLLFLGLIDLLIFLCKKKTLAHNQARQSIPASQHSYLVELQSLQLHISSLM